jgi:hypothetical protein
VLDRQEQARREKTTQPVPAVVEEGGEEGGGEGGGGSGGGGDGKEKAAGPETEAEGGEAGGGEGSKKQSESSGMALERKLTAQEVGQLDLAAFTAAWAAMGKFSPEAVAAPDDGKGKRGSVAQKRGSVAQKRGSVAQKRGSVAQKRGSVAKGVQR